MYHRINKENYLFFTVSKNISKFISLFKIYSCYNISVSGFLLNLNLWYNHITLSGFAAREHFDERFSKAEYSRFILK